MKLSAEHLKRPLNEEHSNIVKRLDAELGQLELELEYVEYDPQRYLQVLELKRLTNELKNKFIDYMTMYGG